MAVLTKIRHTFELIKFSHTVFALPFALAAYFVATSGRVEWRTLLWVLACLVLARTSAMAFNRLADAKIDADNPRTRQRHLPAGLLSQRFVVGLTLVTGVGFLLAARQLNTLAFWLAPFCLAILYLYSLTKRFTHYTQLFLGLALGLAPVGATIAVLGRVTASSLVLGLAVLFWVAGFDLLYSLQDLKFDREHQVHSLPVKLGERGTFLLSRTFHLLFFGLLLVYGYLVGFGVIYWTGCALSALFLLYQHFTLRSDLRKIQAAFFTANGLLSLFFLGFVLWDLYL